MEGSATKSLENHCPGASVYLIEKLLLGHFGKSFFSLSWLLPLTGNSFQDFQSDQVFSILLCMKIPIPGTLVPEACVQSEALPLPV